MTDFDLWTYNVWFNKNEKFSNDRRSLWPRIMSYFTRFSIGFSVSFWCSNCKMLEWLRKSVDFFWMWFINFAILKTLFNTDLINQSQSMNKNWITTKLIRIQQKSITQYWPFCLRLETFDFFFLLSNKSKIITWKRFSVFKITTFERVSAKKQSFSYGIFHEIFEVRSLILAD